MSTSRYQRGISASARRLAASFSALVLTGARQTGKTTLLRELFPEHTYVSLDLPSDAALAEDDPTTFLRRYPPPLLVDEVQYAPKLFRHLKVDIDRHRRERGRFILTGSQKFTLMREVSDSLAGRAALLELETLAASELGDDLARSIDEHGVAASLARGFFPELWAKPEMPRADFYRSYLATYIERDVRQILNVGSLRDFDRFMRVCAVRSGQLLDKSGIARDVGISAKTANDWLGVLQASNQVVLLEPFFHNPGKRVVKSPKLYFADPGLACFLLGVDERTLAGSQHFGAVWETFVCAELRKHLAWVRPEATLWFYRDQQREVDFVVSYGGALWLLEARTKELPVLRDFEGVDKVHGFYRAAKRPGLVVSSARRGFPIDRDHEVVSGFDLETLVERMTT